MKQNSRGFLFTTIGQCVIWLGLASLLHSCGTISQNRMFQTSTQLIGDTLLDAVASLEKNYIIRKYDFLEINVYTNKGERLIDPNQEMGKQLNTGAIPSTSGNSVAITKYPVESSGQVKLPLIGYLTVEGNSLRQLDSILQLKYSEFYQDAFVTSRILNKRVFVLGNAGGKGDVLGRVIPLENENMTVIEVLTMAGGLDHMAKSHKIRLVRGDLRNPNVYLIDLSTIEGVRKSQLNVQPNDIVYVERQRRVLSQVLTEVGPLVMVLNTLLLIFLATQTRL